MTPLEIIEEHYKQNFNRLVLKYYKRCGVKQAGEDIVQEAYTRALMYANAFNVEKNFDNWFSKVLNNAFNDYKNEERGNSFEEFDEELVEGCQENGYYNILRDNLLASIQQYDGENKEILELYFIHGYPPKHIRRLVETKYKTIEQLIYRFKKELREQYGESLGR